MGVVFGDPHKKGYSIMGSMLGLLHFWKLLIRVLETCDFAAELKRSHHEAIVTWLFCVLNLRSRVNPQPQKLKFSP